MAGVTIDIPGIGNVEAKNAATEATLREILKVMQGVQKNTAGGAGGGAGGAVGGAGGSAGAGKSMGNLSKNASSTAGKLGKMGGAAGMVAGALVALGEGVTNTINKFANVGDSVEAAAGVFSGIPILGTMFSAVAAASQKVNDAYLSSAKSGATFGGSINSFAASASAAGMTMDKFGALISRNGAGLLAFGDTTEGGAKRFAQVAKNLQATSSGLHALGYSTEDINQGLANYGEIMRKQGLSRGKSDAELASGAKKYLVEMDALAKITGEERSAKEAQAKALATDAQFQMAMAGKDEKVRADFQNMVLSFGPTLGGFVKDYMATGTLTTEANQKLAAMLGGDVMNEMTKLRTKMQNNQRLTDDEQDRLKQIMNKAATANAKLAGTALAADRGMDDASKGMIEAMGLNDDAHKKSSKEQKDAAKNTDGMNSRMQEAQKSLARISNEFQMFLANSGILETMLSMFKAFAGFTRTVLMPIFSGFATAIQFVWDALSLGLQPAILVLKAVFSAVTAPFRALGTYFEGMLGPVSKLYTVIKDNVLGAFQAVADFIDGTFMDAWFAIFDTIQDYLTPAFNLIGRIANEVGEFLRTNFLEVFKSVSGWFKESFLPGFKAVSDFMKDTFRPILDPVAKVFNDIKTAVGDFFRSFNKLGEIGEWLSLKFQAMGIAFQKFQLYLDEKLTFTDAGKAELAKKQAALAAEEASHKDATMALETRLQKNREENLKSQQTQEKAREKEREDRDKKRHTSQKDGDKGVADHKKELDAKAADKGIDANSSPEALAKQFLTREGSPLVPASESTKAAESTKKEIEQKGQEKTAAEKKAAEEAEAKKKAEEESKNKQEQDKKTQESPSTLLAELNTKMAQLIKLQAQTTTNTAENVMATKGLNKNLYKA
jgi:hypothetical protein